MIGVTPLAQEKLQEYLEKNDISSPIRVILMPGGCSGPALGLALDDHKEEDQVTRVGVLTFLADRALLLQCGTITVDYVEQGARSGFSIVSANPVMGGGGGCSSCSGSCG